jgi:hypothetical protein
MALGQANYMRIQDQVFSKDRILLDGSEFDSCKFFQCVIIYRGEQTTSLLDNTFEDCKFELEGPARLTMRFLKGMVDSSDGFLLTFLKSLELTPARLERLSSNDAAPPTSH